MRRQHGFGLIEVMLAFVIVAATAGTLLQLNKTYLEYSRDGRNREVAMRLAESKLDELRRFQHRAGFTAIDSGSDSLSLDGIEYHRNWTVTAYTWNSASSAWNMTSAGDENTAKKQVEVTISWNEQGEPFNFSLNSVISSTIPAISGPFGSVPDNGSNSKLKVKHTLGQLPDVVAIDLGDGLKQETSKPVITTANNDPSRVRVTEKTTTYDALNNKVQEQELVTVSCNCKLSESDVADLPAHRAMMGILSYWKVGSQEEKQRGQPGNNQDPLCNICCKHHFDGGGNDFLHWYDAIKWKNAGGISGPHAHYESSLNTVADSVGDEYLEACRLVRIDGLFQVANDWNLVVLNVFPESFLVENEDEYQNYIKEVVIEYMRAQVKDEGNYHVDSYVLPDRLASFYDYLGGSNEVSISPLTSVKLVARGIYVDIISPGYRESLLSHMEDTSVEQLLESGFLKLLPFEDKNLDEAVAWYLDDGASDDVLPGKSDGETATIKARILRSNSGLTTNTPISPFEEDNDWITAELTVEMSAAP
ncbi:type II secretion system GspH family protein [Oceanimonas baumannii]|uniref:type IV pilus modification PilV family protein n=1 Tax=Oceanimonas baumannii TaxID=129578 RepID=UPI001D186317|nr:type II secretion system protein [Oceanimonas baumannii]MCC4265711.1 type II secretion system GspH family protein [Oceanimonas baumannii]